MRSIHSKSVHMCTVCTMVFGESPKTKVCTYSSKKKTILHMCTCAHCAHFLKTPKNELLLHLLPVVPCTSVHAMCTLLWGVR